ncbi:MAG: sensor histidine kinase [Sediminispirochaetaceae bacterium]
MKKTKGIPHSHSITGAVIILVLLCAMIVLFFHTSRQQSDITDNQRNISHFYISWMALKNELYSKSFEKTDLYRLILKFSTFKTSMNEVFASDKLTTVRTLDPRVRDNFSAIYVKWPYLDMGLQQIISGIGYENDPSSVHAFLTSPLVTSFEQDLLTLDREVYALSRDQLRRLQILNNLIIIFMLLLFFGLNLHFYFVRQKNEASDRIRDLTQSLLRVQEEEKKQIAYNLHDDIIQDMASLRIRMENMIDEGKNGHPVVLKDLQIISADMQEIIQSTRRISGSIRPYNLDHLGLVGAVRVMCNEMAAQTSIHVQFRPIGLDRLRLDYTTQINIYRIAQEALRNIRKHSAATHVTVRLIASSPHIILRIHDNGRGFNPSHPHSGNVSQEPHIGLTSIEERTRLLHGEFQISAAPGKGTEIKVRVPMHYHSENPAKVSGP